MLSGKKNGASAISTRSQLLGECKLCGRRFGLQQISVCQTEPRQL